MANPTGMVRPDNCQLLHLSESTILHNVRRRFEGEGESEGEGASPQLRAVYTYTGSILLALNPFEKLPLYGTEQMRSYVGRPLGAVAPHTYAMAEEAYRCLLQTKSSQSLVVSGESGAGKTEANKQLMRYLAFRSKKGEQLTDLASTILQSNPVLEAFGNAKTARNDNSSRFGKFVKIAMSDTGEVPCWCSPPSSTCHFTCFLPYFILPYLTLPKVLGATTKQYLLEKSRVPFQGKGERNYHIFYEVCAGLKDDQDMALGQGPSSFWYLAQVRGCSIIRVYDSMIRGAA